MKSKGLAVVVVVVGLLAGFGLRVGFSGGEPLPPRVGAADRLSAATPKPMPREDAAQRAQALEVEDTPAGKGHGAEPDTAPGQDGLAAAREAVSGLPPPPPSAPADGVITVHVRNPSGAAAVGVEVVISRGYRRTFDPEPRIPSGDIVRIRGGDLRTAAERLRDQPPKTFAALSDGDGRAVFAALPTGWDYEIRSPQIGREWMVYINSNWKPLKLGETLTVTADRVRHATIEVVTDAGTALEKASIDFHVANGSRAVSQDWTPDKPQVAFPEGARRVSASTYISGVGTVESETLFTHAPEVPFPGHIRLTVVLPPKASSGVEGVVTALAHSSGSGTPWVHAQESDGVTPPTWAQLELDKFDMSWRWNGGVRPRGDQETMVVDGAYRLHLKPGTYTIMLVQFRRVVAHAFVEIKDSFVKADLRAEADPSTTVGVIARGPDGMKVQDLTFIVRFPAQGDDMNWTAEAMMQSDGSWLVYLPEPPAGSDGPPSHLGTSHPTFGTTWTSLPAGGERVVRVTYAQPARLLLHMTGYDEQRGGGRLVPYPWTLLHGGGLGATAYDRDRTGSGERREFSPLQPGQHVIQLLIPCQGSARFLKLSEQTVELKPGDNPVELPVPKMFSLEIKPFANQWLALVDIEPCAMPRGTSRLTTEWTEHRSQLFKWLPAGDYLLTPSLAPEHGTMRVTVTGDTVVTFVPDPPNAQRVWQIKHDCKLAASGLREGDIFTGADGLAFADTTDMQARLFGAEDRTMALALTRGAKSLEIVVDCRMLQEEIVHGRLTLTPTVR